MNTRSIARRNHMSLLSRLNLRKRTFNDIEVIYKIGEDPFEEEDYQFMIGNVPKNATDADIVESLSAHGQIQKIRSCFLSQTNRREPVILVKYRGNPRNIIQLLNDGEKIMWNVISCTELKNAKCILASSYIGTKDFDDIYSEFENKLYGSPVMHILSDDRAQELGFLGFTFVKSINANLSLYNLSRKTVKIFRMRSAVALVQQLPVLL